MAFNMPNLNIPYKVKILAFKRSSLSACTLALQQDSPVRDSDFVIHGDVLKIRKLYLNKTSLWTYFVSRDCMEDYV